MLMDKEITKLEIEIAPDTARDLQTFFDEQDWDRQEALRSLVGAGLMAMRLKTFDENPEKVLSTQARARWLEVEQDLAVLRFRMFELEQANSRWEMSTGAIKTQNIAFEQMIRAKDQELAELRRIIEEKDKEIERLKNLAG